MAARAEGQALVDRDPAHAERAGPLDEGRAVALVVEEEAGRAVGRPELRVGLERRRAPALGLLGHRLQLAVQRGHAAAVQQQALAAVEGVDGLAGGAGGREVERVARRAARHVRQHAHRRVALEEDVLQQPPAGKALDRVALAAAAVGKIRERVLGRAAAPCALRVHVVQLDVEDELVAAQCRSGRGRLEGRLVRQQEAPAAPAGGREGAIEGRQRGGGAEQRGEVAAARLTEPARGVVGGLARQPARMPRDGVQRHRRELAVGGGVELDRQPRRGVIGRRHGKGRARARSHRGLEHSPRHAGVPSCRGGPPAASASLRPAPPARRRRPRCATPAAGCATPGAAR